MGSDKYFERELFHSDFLAYREMILFSFYLWFNDNLCEYLIWKYYYLNKVLKIFFSLWKFCVIHVFIPELEGTFLRSILLSPIQHRFINAIYNSPDKWYHYSCILEPILNKRRVTWKQALCNFDSQSDNRDGYYVTNRQVAHTQGYTGQRDDLCPRWGRLRRCKI